MEIGDGGGGGEGGCAGDKVDVWVVGRGRGGEKTV